MIKIEDYTIKYASYQFENQKMTLGEFFRKAIPEKGIWLQKYLMGLQKNCFEFFAFLLKTWGCLFYAHGYLVIMGIFFVFPFTNR